MPITLDATVGGATSNSYVSLTDAQAYFDGRLFTDAWDAATSAAQAQALIFATSILDAQKWAGTKGSTPGNAIVQALAWPRRWAPTLEADANPEFVAEYFIDISVAYYSSLTIPRPIIRGTCELALELFKAGAIDPLTRSGDPYRNIKSKKIDVLETVLLDPALRVRGLGFFPSVVAMVAPLLRSGDGVEVSRV